MNAIRGEAFKGVSHTKSGSSSYLSDYLIVCAAFVNLRYDLIKDWDEKKMIFKSFTDVNDTWIIMLKVFIDIYDKLMNRKDLW